MTDPRTAGTELPGPVMFVQPIVDVSTGRAVAVEALARFPDATGTPVVQVFAAAHAWGHGYELEAACVRSSRRLVPTLPAGLDIAVNLSPDALQNRDVLAALDGDLSRVIIEVTEQPASDLGLLHTQLRALRRRGARVAVDDVSTGHAGLLRLAELRPDIIKLDRSVVTSVGTRTEQRAVVEALVHLGRRLGSLVLAEGIETLEQIEPIALLDVDLVQGAGVAPPAAEFRPIRPDVAAACRDARAKLLQVQPEGWHSVVDIHHVTASLAGTARQVELDQALVAATDAIGADGISVSVLDGHGNLREIIATGAELDPTPYPLAGYPATAAALRDGVMLEVSEDQDGADPAERDLLRRLGKSTLLLVPLCTDGQALGVLELVSDSARRWTGTDIGNARVLARHLVLALARLDDAGALPTA